MKRIIKIILICLVALLIIFLLQKNHFMITTIILTFIFCIGAIIHLIAYYFTEEFLNTSDVLTVLLQCLTKFFLDYLLTKISIYILIIQEYIYSKSIKVIWEEIITSVNIINNSKIIEFVNDNFHLNSLNEFIYNNLSIFNIGITLLTTLICSYLTFESYITKHKYIISICFILIHLTTMLGIFTTQIIGYIATLPIPLD